ncbi:glycerophosphodiester phosphodiesterase family protein [Knoellia subterranea]|uniref:glycerophosphodiester phosphodiesterase n=1 Tax=Knoellia subterranea KCTC 19937 TaxID=1385521 RepID=A0A0A0JTN5_9MICO|nr:glycerophosphodiester phosphodiesterase family protein [Knoellia subterranea]KGN39006.1 glycerophosphoryl diester phosphodiesterase [Knoellia subterranea KCTC 19937]
MRRILVSLSLIAGLALPSAATIAPASADAPPASNGKPKFTTPLVHAHRGASGYRPEHTLAAYRLAVQQGADYIEPDLAMTKDGVLIDRHEPEIGGTTNVANHPEFADRKVTKQLDGSSVTGWWVEDFTLAELKTLRATERLPQLRPESASYNGQFEVPTLEEVLELREELSAETGRTVGIIPEIKHSTFEHSHGLDPEVALMEQLTKFGLNRPNAALWVQSFELTNLLRLRHELGYKANSVFLVTSGGAPYDLVAQGDPRTYTDLITPASLKTLSKSINGLGVDKSRVIPRNADGTLSATPTSLVADAHKVGLDVTPWTFRAENSFLPVDYRIGTNPAAHGRIADEVTRFFEAGVDGVFCDQPDICVAARAEFLAR